MVQAEPPGAPKHNVARRAYLVIVAVLQIAMGAELVLLVVGQQWLHAFLVTVIMAVTLAPVLLKRPWLVAIPPEIQILPVLFVFGALFLGEVRGYYERFWWWDLLLHTTAGLLLGLLGFIVVYMLNENAHVDLHMHPAFVAMFAFFFAVGIGALWEIFEFAMDELFGMNMQKPMFGDPSGLTDTMWDMIVDTVGAAIMSVAGWRYLARARRPSVGGFGLRFVERHSASAGE